MGRGERKGNNDYESSTSNASKLPVISQQWFDVWERRRWRRGYNQGTRHQSREGSRTPEKSHLFFRASSPRVMGRWPASLPHSPTSIRVTVGKHVFCPECHPLSRPPDHPCCSILILWIWRGGGQEAVLGGAMCWFLFGMLSGGGMEDAAPFGEMVTPPLEWCLFPQCFHILADNTPDQGYQF